MSNQNNNKPLITTQPKRNSVLTNCISGIIAGMGVAPAVAIIDKAITENASGKNTLLRSIINSLKTLARNPINITNVEYRYIFLIYGGTYCTSNLIDTTCKNYQISDVFPKLIGISVINSGLTIIKDRAFVKLYGTVAPKKVPMNSFLMWGARDALTVICAFIIPSRLGAYLQKKYNWSKSKSEKSAQLFCPIFLQFFSTPLHLLGLDYYNFEANTFKQRLGFLRREYLKSVGARMIRMAPAYGIGGIANTSLRNYFAVSEKN